MYEVKRVRTVKLNNVNLTTGRNYRLSELQKGYQVSLNITSPIQNVLTETENWSKMKTQMRKINFLKNPAKSCSAIGLYLHTHEELADLSTGPTTAFIRKPNET